jgi:DNA-binding transcriptional LysR family regulator
MQLTHIRQSDLNLLPALAVLLEERSISKAAARHHLSQPAMSRVLQRLRDTFDDELLIRTSGGYELTARARRLQDELQLLLPAVDRLLRGNTFDPTTAQDRFRLCCSDYASLVIASRLPAYMMQLAPHTQLEVISRYDTAFDDIVHGRIDVLLWANDVPAPLHSQIVVEDEFVCVLSLDHPLGAGVLTQDAYLASPHVKITNLGAQHTIDDHLAVLGFERRIGLRVPHFGTAVLAVAGTPLIATMPRRAAEYYADDTRVRIVPPPFDLSRLRYLMAWHPRMEADPAQRWFRALLLGTMKEIDRKRSASLNRARVPRP